jgi:hypothetical protein
MENKQQILSPVSPSKKYHKQRIHTDPSKQPTQQDTKAKKRIRKETLTPPNPQKQLPSPMIIFEEESFINTNQHILTKFDFKTQN